MSRSLTLGRPHIPDGVSSFRLQLNRNPKPAPGPGEVLVRLQAAALNRRDSLQHMLCYPDIAFDTPILSDGSGIVESVGPDTPTASELLGKRVVLTPVRDWEDEPEGPPGNTEAVSVIGGSRMTPCGAAQDYVVVPVNEVELAPEHLSPIEAAALPLAGLTAWRALVTKSGNALPGRNILVTGIGGGVASLALTFAVAIGCNVFVTSSSRTKIAVISTFGAVGGVCYRDEQWPEQLRAMLPKERPYLDAVIDCSGNVAFERVLNLMKQGAVYSSYGVPHGEKLSYSWRWTWKNIDLRGTMGGSRAEFREMLAFVAKHRIRPIIGHVIRGLDNLRDIEDAFDVFRQRLQFGKTVLLIDLESVDASPKTE